MPRSTRTGMTWGSDRTGSDAWTTYLEKYHAAPPAITETVLSGSLHPQLGNPYQLLRAALPTSVGRVLDIACGSAPMQPLFPNAEYLGIDVSEAELDVARQRGRGLARSWPDQDCAPSTSEAPGSHTPGPPRRLLTILGNATVNMYRRGRPDLVGDWNHVRGSRPAFGVERPATPEDAALSGVLAKTWPLA